MDWTSLLAGGPFAGMLNPAGTAPVNPTASAGAPIDQTTTPQAPSQTPPMDISPAAQNVAAQPAPGILNGGGNQQALQQAMKMIQQPTPQVPAQPQIQMAKPVGSAAGFDPSRILAAMRGQQLPVT